MKQTKSDGDCGVERSMELEKGPTVTPVPFLDDDFTSYFNSHQNAQREAHYEIEFRR